VSHQAGDGSLRKSFSNQDHKGDTQSDRELIPHPQIFARIVRATTPAIKFHATSGAGVNEHNNEEYGACAD